jgi:hypothetical protein
MFTRAPSAKGLIAFVVVVTVVYLMQAFRNSKPRWGKATIAVLVAMVLITVALAFIS